MKRAYLVYVSRPRRAFTLLEMIVVMAMLAILMALGTATITGLLRVEQAASAASRRLAERAELATQFRTDVAQSAAAPEKAEGETAGPACLLLRRPDGVHIVYLWKDGRLRRRETGGPAEGPVVLTAEGATVEFTRTADDPPRLTLRLSDLVGREARARWTEITAVLGGDLR
jgi:prepilin-type N-terminal cleavage/methylation domain-containing protein